MSLLPSKKLSGFISRCAKPFSCIDCNIEIDAEATKLGVFEEYKNYRVFSRAIAKAKEAKEQIQSGIKELKPHYEYILENGKTEVFIPPLTITPAGITLPSKGYGKSY